MQEGPAQTRTRGCEYTRRARTGGRALWRVGCECASPPHVMPFLLWRWCAALAPLSLQATPIPTRPSLMHRRTCDPGVCSVFLAMSGRLRRSWLSAASHSRSNAAAPSPGEGNKKRQTERQKDKKNSEYLRVKVRERKIGSIKIGNREGKLHQGFTSGKIRIVVPHALQCLYYYRHRLPRRRRD